MLTKVFTRSTKGFQRLALNQVRALSSGNDTKLNTEMVTTPEPADEMLDTIPDLAAAESNLAKNADGSMKDIIPEEDLAKK